MRKIEKEIKSVLCSLIPLVSPTAMWNFSMSDSVSVFFFLLFTPRTISPLSTAR